MSDKQSNLAGTFSRLQTPQLKKLVELATNEIEKRNGKDVSGMTDSQFRAHVEQELRKADAAAREADLREMLASKDDKKDSKDKPNQKEDDNE